MCAKVVSIKCKMAAKLLGDQVSQSKQKYFMASRKNSALINAMSQKSNIFNGGVIYIM